MKKIIKTKKADSVHLSGKIIGIYQKHNKQISKVLLESSVVELDLRKLEVNLGENIQLETDVNLSRMIVNKSKFKKKKAS